MASKVRAGDMVKLLYNYTVETPQGRRALPAGTVLKVVGRSVNGGCRYLADPQTGLRLGLFVKWHFEKVESEEALYGQDCQGNKG